MRAASILEVSTFVAMTAVMPARALAENDADAAAALRAEITELIGEARCNNLVNCRILALGSASCGGAEEYVAYSVWSTNGEDVRSKAMEYNFLREEIVARDGVGKRCEVLPEPRAACVNGHCAAVRGR